MIKNIVLNASLVFLFSFVANARPDSELTDFVSREIGALQMPSDNNASMNGQEFELQRFWIRIQAKAGIEIPGLSKFQVIPEIEIGLQKQ